MALNDLKLKHLKAENKRYLVFDSGGLYIQVYPSGKKAWIFRYQFEGRPRKLNLGQYPAVPLSEARQKAAEAAQTVHRGMDPGEIKKKEKAKAHSAPTFSAMLDEFWDRELKDKKSGKERRRLIEHDCLAAWKHTKVRSITRRDIVVLLDRIRDRAPVTANRVQGALARFFNFCAERGVIDDSPCTRIRRVKEQPRQRILSGDELKKFWLNLDKIDIWPVTRLALKFLLVTGQRPGEVVGATWDEIDGNLWIIPSARMKNREDHAVPLSDTALEILADARQFSYGQYVFPSSFNEGKKPIARASLGRAIIRHLNDDRQKNNRRNSKNLGIDKFTPHDLRRTVRSEMAALGVDDIVAEKVLSHKLQGIAAVYNRHDYLREKRQALEKWERHLRKLVGLPVKDGKVIHLDQAASL